LRSGKGVGEGQQGDGKPVERGKPRVGHGVSCSLCLCQPQPFACFCGRLSWSNCLSRPDWLGSSPLRWTENSRSHAVSCLFKGTFILWLLVSGKPRQLPNHVAMRPVQFTSDCVISQPPCFRLHLADNGRVGSKKLWRRTWMTDEIAEVNAGYERIAISAGQRGRAADSQVRLQPSEYFFLCFHKV